MPLLLLLKQVEWSSLGDVKHGLELELTLDGKVLDGKVVLPVVGDGLVERRVLLWGDVGWVPASQLGPMSIYFELTWSRWAFAC